MPLIAGDYSISATTAEPDQGYLYGSVIYQELRNAKQTDTIVDHTSVGDTDQTLPISLTTPALSAGSQNKMALTYNIVADATQPSMVVPSGTTLVASESDTGAGDYIATLAYDLDIAGAAQTYEWTSTGTTSLIDSLLACTVAIDDNGSSIVLGTAGGVKQPTTMRAVRLEYTTDSFATDDRGLFWFWAREAGGGTTSIALDPIAQDDSTKSISTFEVLSSDGGNSASTIMIAVTEADMPVAGGVGSITFIANPSSSFGHVYEVEGVHPNIPYTGTVGTTFTSETAVGNELTYQQDRSVSNVIPAGEFVLGGLVSSDVAGHAGGDSFAIDAPYDVEFTVDGTITNGDMLFSVFHDEDTNDSTAIDGPYNYTITTVSSDETFDSAVILTFIPTPASAQNIPILLDATWWIDPTDINTLFEDNAKLVPVTTDGDPVAVPADISGNGYDLENDSFYSDAEPANRPTYRSNEDGFPALEFDGSVVATGQNGQWLYNPNSLEVITVAFVYKRSADGVVIGLSDSDNRYAHMKAGTPYYWASPSYSTINVYTETLNTWHIVIGELRNSVYLDDVFHDFAINDDQSSNAPLWLGRRANAGTGHQPFDGFIRTAMTFNKRFTSGERDELYQYLVDNYT